MAADRTPRQNVRGVVEARAPKGRRIGCNSQRTFVLRSTAQRRGCV
jgi:hypothetical protein